LCRQKDEQRDVSAPPASISPQNQIVEILAKPAVHQISAISLRHDDIVLSPQVANDLIHTNQRNDFVALADYVGVPLACGLI
jgi:hypothetical protein